MNDIDILIANYQNIIRDLAKQVRTLELQVHEDGAGCALLPEECNALDALIMDSGDKFASEHGTEEVAFLLFAWEKIRKGRYLND